ncbi:MsnO8 family LLM class oxidoreductase [Paraburkholderia fungorum]|uniref:Alkane 1-monooxygenase n=1 Tax=Paraburkholderia fungorum TaxID=134537 RepID=A0A3R7HJ40_9BURK|nr:MsnO8 family LLM class oxidoreductase [Paraburkholderia fungorum]RKF48439.1 alkane 1-monooxygenase [Paraburkholderia fungorum]
MTYQASQPDHAAAKPAFRLSVLDKSPIAHGESAADALARSVELARAAEAWGYHRYWFAEHHNTSALACPTPEILIAHVLAHTHRIRVGSGGVMLQHYSPYKIAENFNLLAALAPGRVDMGIGKAPGGLPLSTRALQGTADPSHRRDFTELASALNQYLRATDLPAAESDNNEAVLRATPLPPASASPFLLGASVDSATLAAQLGWDFVYAAHINAAPADIERAFERYRSASGGRAPLLAISVVVAGTRAEAARLADGFRRFRVQVGNAQAVNVGSLEQAHTFVRQSGGGAHRIEERETYIVHGTRDDALRELGELQRRYGPAEFIVDTPVVEAAPRIASLRLLAGGHGGTHTATDAHPARAHHSLAVTEK